MPADIFSRCGIPSTIWHLLLFPSQWRQIRRPYKHFGCRSGCQVAVNAKSDRGWSSGVNPVALKQLPTSCFADRILLYLARFVEWQVKEMTVIQRDIIVCTCSACLATANQSLNGQDVACIQSVFFFQEFRFLLQSLMTWSSLLLKIWLNPLMKCRKRITSSSPTAMLPEVS